VLDAQIPDLNGLQLQRHLTSEGWSIPIIFIIAYGNIESGRKAMQGGAVAFRLSVINSARECSVGPNTET